MTKKSSNQSETTGFIVVITMAVACVGPAYADMFKCIDAHGRVTYSDRTCGTLGGSVRVIDPIVNVVDGTKEREAAARQKRENIERAMSYNAQPTQAARQSPADSDECKQALRSYEFEVGSIKKDRSAIAAKKRIVDITCSNTGDGKASLLVATTECTQAQRTYDLEATSIRKNSGVIRAKRVAMNAACGNTTDEDDHRNQKKRWGNDHTENSPSKSEIGALGRPCAGSNDFNCYVGSPNERPCDISNLRGFNCTRLSPPISPIITSCDGDGCWDNSGTRYMKGGGSTLIGPNGTCEKFGMTIRCP